MTFRWLILLLFLLHSANSLIKEEERLVFDILTNSTNAEDSSDETLCECSGDDMVEKANYTLTVEVKNMQVRLIEPFRDAIAFVASEKQHLMSFLKFAVLRDMKASHPTLLDYTPFYDRFSELMETLKNILTTENEISLSGIKYEVNTAVTEFLSTLLPDMFLCLSVGKCRTVPMDYFLCMQENTKHWSSYLGSSPAKMILTVAETIYRYRKVEFLLVDMHKQLMNAQNLTVTEKCLQEYVFTLPCNCTTNGIGRCHASCSNSMETCFGKYSREWAAKLHLMRNMTNIKKGYLHNLLTLKKTIFTAIRLFLERKSFHYAEHVFKSCGPLGEMIIHPSKRTVRIRSPGPFVSRADGAVRELQLSAKMWERLGRKICDHTGVVLNPAVCFDGTKVIGIEHELPPITKDVRPRPMMDWIEKRDEKKTMNVEGSASNPLWDDEDSDDVFDGSGSGQPAVVDNEPVKAIIQQDHPKNIDLSTNPKGPSVIVTEKETVPDGSSAYSVLMCFLVMALARIR